VWTSDSAVLTQGGAVGAVYTSGIRAFTCGSRVASVTHSLSYQVPVTVKIWNVANAPSTGSVAVHLSGAALGSSHASPGGRFGAAAATTGERTEWTSDTAVAFATPAGTAVKMYSEAYGGVPSPASLSSASSKVLVTAGVSVGTISESFTFSFPLHLTTSAYPTAPGLNVPSGAMPGAQRPVTLNGAGLCLADYTVAVRVQATGAQRSSWISSTTVAAQVAAGSWNYLATTATIGVLHGTASVAFSYDGGWPYICLLQQGGVISTNISVGGGELMPRDVVVSGSFLGGDAMGGASVLMRVGSTSCEGSVWLSSSAVFCRAANGVGSFLSIVLTVDKAINQTSVITTLSLAFTYHAPTITGSNPVNLRPSRESPAHSSMLTLLGYGFGAVADVSISAKVGQTACEAGSWISDSAIRALVASGTSAVALPASVSVATRYLSSWVDQDNRRFYDMVRQACILLLTCMYPPLHMHVSSSSYDMHVSSSIQGLHEPSAVI
jgi:hypothetical protein